METIIRSGHTVAMAVVVGILTETLPTIEPRPTEIAISGDHTVVVEGITPETLRAADPRPMKISIRGDPTVATAVVEGIIPKSLTTVNRLPRETMTRGVHTVVAAAEVDRVTVGATTRTDKGKIVLGL